MVWERVHDQLIKYVQSKSQNLLKICAYIVKGGTISATYLGLKQSLMLDGDIFFPRRVVSSE